MRNDEAKDMFLDVELKGCGLRKGCEVCMYYRLSALLNIIKNVFEERGSLYVTAHFDA